MSMNELERKIHELRELQALIEEAERRNDPRYDQGTHGIERRAPRR